jgi:hypothetical protein
MKKNWLQRLFWIMQFKFVVLTEEQANAGRCPACDAGADPKVECCDYGCPCEWNEQLKRRKISRLWRIIKSH